MKSYLMVAVIAVSFGSNLAYGDGQIGISAGGIRGGLIKRATITKKGSSSYADNDSIELGIITGGTVLSASAANARSSKVASGSTVTVADLKNARIQNATVTIISVNGKAGNDITAAQNVEISSADIEGAMIDSATITSETGSQVGVCNIADTGCIDISATAGIAFFSAKSGTYTFESVSPELRYRFHRDEGKNLGNWLVALGSPLVNNLNQNATGGQSSAPTSIFKTSLYVAIGFMGAPRKLFANSDLSYAPIVQAGWMSQEIDKTNGVYDKGGFIMFGLTTNLASF